MVRPTLWRSPSVAITELNGVRRRRSRTLFLAKGHHWAGGIDDRRPVVLPPEEEPLPLAQAPLVGIVGADGALHPLPQQVLKARQLIDPIIHEENVHQVAQGQGR